MPPIILLTLAQFGLRPVLEDLWVSILPSFAAPPSYDAGEIRGPPEVQAQLVGAWWLWGLFLFMAVFNDFLGEELLFPGVLLPKMKGVFGKWDWVANGVLFGAYHLHHPWGILDTIVILMFLGSFPARQFQSTWMSIIVHSADGVFPLFIILGLVLVLAGIIFIASRWGVLPGPAKFAVTLLVTGLFYLGGYSLYQRLSLRLGGIAVMGVASGFLPLNFAVLQIYVLGPGGLRADVMWLIAWPMCLLLYLIIAYCMRSDLFTCLSVGALAHRMAVGPEGLCVLLARAPMR